MYGSDLRPMTDACLQSLTVLTKGVQTDTLTDLTAWDLDAKRQLWQRALRYGAISYRPYAISPDGKALAAVLNENTRRRVQVLETQDGGERFTIKSAGEYATSVMFSPDSATLLTGAGFTDSTIRLWDAHSGKAVGLLEGHRSYVSDLLFTPDGKRLISSSGDQTIRLWDWATRQPAGVLRGHLNEVDGLALAPDGRTLASRCKDGSIYLWDVTKPSRHLGYQIFPTAGSAGKSNSRPTVNPSWKFRRLAVNRSFGTLTLSRRRTVPGRVTRMVVRSFSHRTPTRRRGSISTGHPPVRRVQWGGERQTHYGHKLPGRGFFAQLEVLCHGPG